MKAVAKEAAMSPMNRIGEMPGISKNSIPI
jgi:hypothetical protein